MHYENFGLKLMENASKYWEQREVGKLAGLIASTMRWHRDR
jgi:hypothetical protein